MEQFKILTISLCAFFLFGCTHQTRMDQMSYDDIPNSRITFDTALNQSITVGTVTGGEHTNPDWKSRISNSDFTDAVKNSLAGFGLLSEDGRYNLSISLIRGERPSFGGDMIVATDIKYVLTDSQTRDKVFEETIHASYTVTQKDAWLAIQRLRLANEGSAKESIKGFIGKLAELNIQVKDISAEN